MKPVLHLGDCLEVMRGMPDGAVDSVVCDPPYGLNFMNKHWDCDIPSVEIWAECLRVLKPGGHLLAFAGTRTQHRMACRIEDAGFEIRDMIAWLYGSGMPKSLDVSKAIDKAAGAEREKVLVPTKLGNAATRSRSATDMQSGFTDISAPATDAALQWQGWGTALKPALEPITVARKPLAGTVAANVLAHGTGALNIDGCRIGDNAGWAYPKGRGGSGWHGRDSLARNLEKPMAATQGRWPANLIHDGSEEVLRAFPDSPGQQGRARTDGADQGNNTFGALKHVTKQPEPRGDTGSAARFFYCAKASKRDRGEGNNHPTVKPTDLMRYLCCLVTPPGGVVLDPFMGSGSTGKAAVLEGFDFIGIERDPTYFLIAAGRIQGSTP